MKGYKSVNRGLGGLFDVSYKVWVSAEMQEQEANDKTGGAERHIFILPL